MAKPEEARFLGFANHGKQVFLADLGLALTITARAAVRERHREQAIATLAGLNELQHKIMSHISALGTDSERYSDEVFWSVLDETAAVHAIGEALNDAIGFAASRPQ
jgi:hypothetical protein